MRDIRKFIESRLEPFKLHICKHVEIASQDSRELSIRR
jgi:hypothetical protein